MARREWTLWVASDDQTNLRQYRLPKRLVRLAAFAILVVSALLGSALTRIWDRTGLAVREGRLLTENELLETEIEELAQRVEGLNGSIERLAEQDETYRLLAGLEPTDPAVLQVGIGGPGMVTAEGSPLYSMNRGAATRIFRVSSRVDELLRRSRLLAHNWSEATDSLKSRMEELSATPSILPTDGTIVSSFTGSRWHPILDRPRPHLGLDIVAAKGTPIRASAKGRISFVGTQGGYGLTVEVDHGYGRVTRYAHASKILVRKGQLVTRGETVALVGMTGLAVGPHLHYEVLVNGQPINPRRFIFNGDVVRD